MTPAPSSQMAINQVVLTGRVAKNLKFHHQPNGTPVLQFSLELNSSENVPEIPPVKGPQDSWRLKKDGHRTLVPIVAYGTLAQSRSTIQTGDHLLVEGQLNQRQWKTPEGAIRDRIEVIASDLRPVNNLEMMKNDIGNDRCEKER